MEVSAVQYCGNMYQLNRTKRRFCEYFCLGKFLWKVLAFVKHLPTHSRGVLVQSQTQKQNYTLYTGQRFIPRIALSSFRTTGPGRTVCVVVNLSCSQSLFSLLITWVHKTVLNLFSLLFIRLRKGEVEPKPTLVALSRESGKKSSTGESDGVTDNEYSYTDDDTDGERLVTANKPPPVTRSADDVRYSIFFP